MTAGSTTSVLRTSSQLLKFLVARRRTSPGIETMPSTRKRIPFKSLDVSLLRCVTLGTFTVAEELQFLVARGTFYLGCTPLFFLVHAERKARACTGASRGEKCADALR